MVTVGPKPRQEAALGPGLAGSRVDRLHAGRAFHLDGGGVGVFHHPIDLHLPDPPAKGLHQGGDELVGHRTPPGDPTEASRQAEGLCVANGEDKLPVACHLVQHVVNQLVVSCAEPDYLGDPHLDVADLCGCGHGRPPSSPAKAIFLPSPS
jgi:hypothetical protein